MTLIAVALAVACEIVAGYSSWRELSASSGQLPASSGQPAEIGRHAARFAALVYRKSRAPC